MQSFELARVLEGEKAMRSEVARKKADVDRHLSQAQACADSAAAEALQAEQSALHAQLQKHSNQVCNHSLGLASSALQMQDMLLTAHILTS